MSDDWTDSFSMHSIADFRNLYEPDRKIYKNESDSFSPIGQFSNNLVDENIDMKQEKELMKMSAEERLIKIKSNGSKLFNINPLEGIGYLINYKVLNMSAKCVAKFLKYDKSLRLYRIGQYLSISNVFNNEVLLEYLNLFNFTNVHVEKAFREVWKSFHFPEEELALNYIIRNFASIYVQKNPHPLKRSEVIDLCQFMTILHRNLSNTEDNDKARITKDTFAYCYRKIFKNENLPLTFLTRIYESIKNEPFTRNYLTHINYNVILTGWIWMKITNINYWTKCRMLVKEGCLYYLKNDEVITAGIMYPLKDVTIEHGPDKTESFYNFKLYKNNSDYIECYKFDGIDVHHVKAPPLELSCENKWRGNDWNKAFKEAQKSF